ncbi:hypothetical protein ACFLUR_01330 [Chloroflexota bacterium]
MDIILEVLKWIGIVLAAGFIGYIGRYLAGLIIERMHKRREASSPPAPGTSQETPPSLEIQLEEAKLKVEKKKAKAEAKRLKKAQDK